jgi:hypothetical protein
MRRSRIAVVLALAVCTGAATPRVAVAEMPGAMAAAVASGATHVTSAHDKDAVLAKAYRFERDGWIYVHLEGSPHDIGFQHGVLLANEIADAYAAIQLNMTHSTGRDWDFFRRASRQMLWPKIDPEYQQELQGIADGLASKRVKLDLEDVIAMNAFMEIADYYVPWLDAQTKVPAPPSSVDVHDHCSAFVAVGSYTKNGQIVMAHNNWTDYFYGVHWNIIFDIVPDKGYAILMDGFPGVIASDDDFGVNSDGMMITETTISDFHGWDVNGKPEFVRARKAMQYAGSIDEYVQIMLDGNNGGYANDWLLADRKTGEIARFELGLQHTNVWKTKDGYFVGSNFASDPQVIRDETTFDVNNKASSPNARHARWDELMEANRGKIDTTLAEAFLSDHYDTYEKKEAPNHRTLCGHGDQPTPGDPTRDKAPFNPTGSVEGKVIDTHMAETMSFVARIGHPCGKDFKAQAFLDAHPEYRWQSPILRDMDAGPWSQYHSGEHKPSATAGQ